MTSLKVHHESLILKGVGARMGRTVGQPDEPSAFLACSRTRRDHDGSGEDPGINATHQTAGT